MARNIVFDFIDGKNSGDNISRNMNTSIFFKYDFINRNELFGLHKLASMTFFIFHNLSELRTSQL